MLQFDINSEKSTPGEITVISVLYYFEDNESAPRQICNYFFEDDIPGKTFLPNWWSLHWSFAVVG